MISKFAKVPFRLLIAACVILLNLSLGCSKQNKDQENATACVNFYANKYLADPRSAYLISYSKSDNDKINVEFSYAANLGIKKRESCTCRYDGDGIMNDEYSMSLIENSRLLKILNDDADRKLNDAQQAVDALMEENHRQQGRK